MSDARDALVEVRRVAALVVGTQPKWSATLTSVCDALELAQSEHGAVAEGVPREPTKAMCASKFTPSEGAFSSYELGFKAGFAAGAKTMRDAAPRAGEAKEQCPAMWNRFHCSLALAHSGDHIFPATPPAPDAAPTDPHAYVVHDGIAPDPPHPHKGSGDRAAPDAGLIADLNVWANSTVHNPTRQEDRMIDLLQRCRDRLAQIERDPIQRMLIELRMEAARKDKALREFLDAVRGHGWEDCDQTTGEARAVRFARAALSDTQEPRS